MSKSRKKEMGDMTKAAGEQFWGTETMSDAPKAADLVDSRLWNDDSTSGRDIPRE